MGNFAENLSLGKRVLPPWEHPKKIVKTYGCFLAVVLQRLEK